MFFSSSNPAIQQGQAELSGCRRSFLGQQDGTCLAAPSFCALIRGRSAILIEAKLALDDSASSTGFPSYPSRRRRIQLTPWYCRPARTSSGGYRPIQSWLAECFGRAGNEVRKSGRARWGELQPRCGFPGRQGKEKLSWHQRGREGFETHCFGA